VAVHEPDPDPDAGLLGRLRAGDEDAFATLVARHHPAMLRVARLHVRDAQAAEEVVQETWLIVVKGIAGFEERSTLRTWIFRILTNRAKTRGVREARTTPFSALVRAETGGEEPAVDPSRFQGPDGPWPGHWAAAPSAFEQRPDDRLIAAETLERLHEAIDHLPAAQREIIRLRDVEGWPAAEVCELFQLSQGNQRVLLHRARSKVRAALETYLEPERTA
jgi:RNA polymerase sigma-70 factor (ECF subfamily)